MSPLPNASEPNALAADTLAPLMEGLRRKAASWAESTPKDLPREMVRDLAELGLIGYEADLDTPSRAHILRTSSKQHASTGLMLLARWLAVDLLQAASANIPDGTIGLPLWTLAEFVGEPTLCTGWQEGASSLLFSKTDGQVELKIAEFSTADIVNTMGLKQCRTIRVSQQDMHTYRPVGMLDNAVFLQIWQQAELYASALRAGILDASYDTALAWARARTQGGKKIIEHGIVQRMLTTMHNTSHELNQIIGALIAVPKKTMIAPGILAGTNRLASDTVEACSLGVQILGGNGYMNEYKQSGRLCDAQQAQMLLGHPSLRYREKIA